LVCRSRNTFKLKFSLTFCCATRKLFIIKNHNIQIIIMELIYVISETKEQCLSLVSDLTAEVLQRRHRFSIQPTMDPKWGPSSSPVGVISMSKLLCFNPSDPQFQCCPAPQTMLNNCFSRNGAD
jgi:hypothetical protein